MSRRRGAGGLRPRRHPPAPPRPRAARRVAPACADAPATRAGHARRCRAARLRQEPLHGVAHRAPDEAHLGGLDALAGEVFGGGAQTGLDVRDRDGELGRAERGGDGEASELAALEVCDHLRVEGFCAAASRALHSLECRRRGTSTLSHARGLLLWGSPMARRSRPPGSARSPAARSSPAIDEGTESDDQEHRLHG